MVMTASQEEGVLESEAESLACESSCSSECSICYQCGSPNNPKLEIHYPVLGKERCFCCYGCHAVAKMIVDNGMEEYYKYRESVDGSQVPTESLPEFLKDLSVYDNLEVQQSFVRAKKDGLQEAYLLLEDIRCAACVWLNEQQLRALNGVMDVSMDYTSHQARVVWDPRIIALSEILHNIALIGYKAYPFDPTQRENLIAEQKSKSISKILFSLLLGMEVMAHAIATYWMGGVQSDGKLALWEIIGRYTDLIVVTVMLSYSGADFYQSAWRDLKNKQLGMDIPIVLGLTTAYVGSVVATFTQQHDVYFDSIAMFIVLILIARYFELNGRIIAGNSLDRLLKIIPKKATREGIDGIETVLVTELNVGDCLLINPGETVPVDGLLHEGYSSFDESLLTGEVMPVMHHVGDKIISGSCNIDQPVKIIVERNSNESALNDIKTLLDKGIESKPIYAILAQQAAKWFVLAVLVIALITTVVWWQLAPERILPIVVSVLIITCPCALALATPVALSLSSGAFARLGILPMRMASIEELTSADTIVFDKTGTLTLGKPVLKDAWVLSDEGTFIEAKDTSDYEYLCEISASLEWHSEHPIAKAVKAIDTRLVKQKIVQNSAPFKVKNLMNFPGEGINGEIDGNFWSIGKLEFCSETVESLRADQQKMIVSARNKGHIIVGLAKQKKLQLLFILEDALRPQVAETLATLKKQGMNQIVILSGDHPDSVKQVANQLGIQEFYGHKTPEGKLNWIQARQKKGCKIIMVGDGINDAPTLAAANVSISFAEATELAQINSDFVLISQQLNRLPEMIRIAIRTRRIIVQNLTWAIGYNLVAVPFAAMGLIPPWGAALGMSLSSFIVISNSLRLKLGEKNDKQQR